MFEWEKVSTIVLFFRIAVLLFSFYSFFSSFFSPFCCFFLFVIDQPRIRWCFDNELAMTTFIYCLRNLCKFDIWHSHTDMVNKKTEKKTNFFSSDCYIQCLKTFILLNALFNWRFFFFHIEKIKNRSFPWCSKKGSLSIYTA
jgi:hypothetical protein